MKVSRSRLFVGGGLAWLVSAAGCGQVLGTDEYRTARPVDEGSGGAGGEAPAVDPCFACIEASCTEAIDICLGNPSCAPAYPCIYQCTDPDCVRRCASEELSLQEAFTGNQTAGLDDGVIEKCSEACELPHGDWDCVDDYDFASVYQAGDRIEVPVHVADPQGSELLLEGYEIAACQRDELNDCPEPQQVETSALSPITFELPLSPVGYRGFFKVTDPTGADPFTYVFRADPPIFDHGLTRGALFADPAGLALTFVLSAAGLTELPAGAGMIVFARLWDCRMWDFQKPDLEVTVEPTTTDTHVFPLITPSWVTPDSTIGVIAPSGDVTITFSYEGQVVRRMERRIETNVVETWTHVFPQWAGSI